MQTLNNIVTDTEVIVSNAMAMLNEKQAELAKARTQLVNKAKGTGEVINTYARILCELYDIYGTDNKLAFKWYERKGKLKQPINEERDLFVKDMSNAGFDKPTITTYWQRVKVASGYITPNNRVSGGEVNIDDVTKKELNTIINRIYKSEEDNLTTNNKALDAMHLLVQAFEALGGDVTKLGTK